MLKSYFNIAMRIIFANKVYSSISVGGLAFGLAACLLVMLFVADELNYDRWITDSDIIYKVETTYLPKNSSQFATSKTPFPVLPAIQKKYPEVSQGVRLLEWGNKVRREDMVFFEQVTYVEPSFFEIFDLPITLGDRVEALQNQSSVLISEKIAQKYFGSTDPRGEILTIDSFGRRIDYKVVGVLKDIPQNTHFELDILTLLDVNNDVFKSRFSNWYSASLHTYIKVPESVDVDLLNENLADLAADYVDNEKLVNEENVVINLIAMLDIHLFGDKERQRGQNGSIAVVVSYVMAAILVLFIACINFVNLSTARATMRAKEVGLRKVMGATRPQVALQFLSESLFFTLAAFVVAFILAGLILPWFSLFLDKSLSIWALFNPALLSLMILLFLVVGIAAGLYPSMVLSSYRPSKTLRSNKSAATGNSWVRTALVVMQFAISVALMVSTTIAYKQALHINNLDKGFNNVNKVNLYVGSHPNQSSAVLKQEFLNIEGVTAAGFAGDVFPRIGSKTSDVKLMGQANSGRLVSETMDVGNGFFNVYEVKAIAGRLFPEGEQGNIRRDSELEGGQGTGDIVVNELFINRLGIQNPNDAIGVVVSNGQTNSTIIGVVQNLHLRSLHFPVRPIIFNLTDEDELRVITIAVKSSGLVRTLAEVDSTWRSLLPDLPVRRSFVDDDFFALYESENRQIDVLTVFTIVAMFVATMGLYGLASFTVERRYKEVGIRKVLGASSPDIILLLMWQCTKPVFAGSVIGLVAAYILMQSWLQNFVNSIGMGEHLYVFISAVLISFAIAWLTTFFQVKKVATASPIFALRYE